MGLESNPNIHSPEKVSAQPKRSHARYDVKEQLGSGGMSAVYCVLDRSVGELRAMKRVTADVPNREYALKAIEREYQILASLDHPRIIRVFDYGVDELGPYYTMEYLEGQDMRRAAPLPFKQACFYLRDVATSLALLHARRLIYRDLSPGNIRVTKDGHCKLLDFGALTSFGHSPIVVGTPPFIAPEVIDGAPLDQRADLYALGALAYFLLTGKHAYPARQIAELPERWSAPPARPSSHASEIPRELDDLIQSLLRSNPFARPASAAEVIARLEVIGNLPVESTGDAERLVQRFLLSPRFTGRIVELGELQALTEAAVQGRGAAVCIQSVAGMGRTRLLDEIAVRAQVAGATVVRADAGMYRQRSGVTRALASRLYDADPELAARYGARYRYALLALGSEFETRFVSQPPTPPVAAPVQTDTESVLPLEGWFTEISQAKPLVILVDNVEYADDLSLGLLASLAKISTEHPLLLVVTERITRELGPLGLVTLRRYSRRMELSGLEAHEMQELVRSLFADAPNVQRFAEWLHERTAGSPLYAMELCRQLAAKQIIRYSGDIWTLPVERPDAELPPGLSDALSIRLAELNEPARSLAECLSLQREQPTLELCRLLSDGLNEREVLRLLDELASHDVLYSDADGYRFSSTALREALLASMDGARLEQNHRRLGEAFAQLAGTHNPALRIEAGWHLIQGNDEVRGAEMIAAVALDERTIRVLTNNMSKIGHQIEAALKVYNRHRRTIYERLPLLSALAQACYYEDSSWGDRYGDHTLDILEDLTGLRMAKRLTPVLGGWLSLILGTSTAFIRFQISKPRELKYSFDKLFVTLFAVVTTLSGAATLVLDVARASRIAAVLEPFAILPDRMTPKGIFQICRGVAEIGTENFSTTYPAFEILIRHLEDLSWYRALPSDARQLYTAASRFVCGSLAVFRGHGEAALENADRLEATGLKLYTIIASQIRYLYYTMRGEFAKAAPHHDQVELHAAHYGSIWQVEAWETPAMILVHLLNLSDIVASTRIAERIELMSRTLPSLKRYGRIARRTLLLARRDTRFTGVVAAEYEALVPRSYIGWTATMSALARGYNEDGKHAEAKAVCERTLRYVTDADREYVALFSGIEIEMAIAQAGLGQPADGIAILDALLERFADSDHPLLHGLLHEARARITWSAAMAEQYAISLAEVERLFRYSGASPLIAKYHRLAQLGAADKTVNALTALQPVDTSDVEDALKEDNRETEVVIRRTPRG